MDRDYELAASRSTSCSEMVVQSNEPTILEEESFRTLMDLTTRTFVDLDGNHHPYLTPNEVSALSIRKGSLSEKERREIESHVTHTFKFLSQIPWTGEFRRVPEIAYAHHEKMDGTGYPRRLSAADIPLQSRMMAISDIFDALVAWDRPYKKAVPVEKALDILRQEAGAGKLDQPVLDVFVEAQRVREDAAPHRRRNGSRALTSRRDHPLDWLDAPARHRPPGRLRESSREHPRLLRLRPGDRRRLRGVRRAAHEGRPRGRHPRPHPRPHHRRRRAT